MSDRPSIEEVLKPWQVFTAGDGDNSLRVREGSEIADALAAAVEDGPLIDQDRGLVVMKADPELAAFLQRHIDNLPVNTRAAIGWKLDKIVRLVAGEVEDER